ncbi:LURP-one-related family protein [Oscillibacter sp.]|uniref:LURP-one-related/scramblase family protein n=1 Tax=Oscillibacter sp. TaxID=1945593 RepID=UPI00260FC741|nr:LURP-one-related family protein [Oscillibacter sp.]MDD3346254.1 LURP-one-related family protein [Oscillibacter sp.]
MRLLFKQRFFSWLDSYDIYDEMGNTVYTVEGKLAWGHCLHVLDGSGNHVGTVKERVLTFLPKFEMYMGEEYVGCIRKEFTFFTPRFDIDCNGWRIDGDFMEWDYAVRESCGALVATVSKQLLNWTDTYAIDVQNPADALGVLMLVLAIDAEKCSRSN